VLSRCEEGPGAVNHGEVKKGVIGEERKGEEERRGETNREGREGGGRGGGSGTREWNLCVCILMRQRASLRNCRCVCTAQVHTVTCISVHTHTHTHRHTDTQTHTHTSWALPLVKVLLCRVHAYIEFSIGLGNRGLNKCNYVIVCVCVCVWECVWSVLFPVGTEQTDTGSYQPLHCIHLITNLQWLNHYPSTASAKGQANTTGLSPSSTSP